MSETATTHSASQHPPDNLLNLVVTLLTPMFLLAAGGDLTFAHLAAAETLDCYRAETKADLITVAKIIAFGLAALASLSRSMEDDLSISQMLRLRSNANASDRAEHRNRLALERSRLHHPAAPPLDLKPAIDEAAPAADIQQRTTQNLADRAPRQSAPAIDAATWAASAAAIAAETAATLPSLPPDERHSAEIWIEALNEVAKDFMTGGIPPRLRPGDLVALTQQAAP